jgi:N-acetyl-gamma-glutamyl-phosphate/LysW-gamma-L-alpha-aminoadipyl-6-phosphate reductase
MRVVVAGAAGYIGGYYGSEHQAPHLLDAFVPGLPEPHRERLRGADLISVPGCMATAGVLALHPLVAHELIDTEAGVQLDARTGSSGSASTAGPANLHAERSGAMREFAPNSHRHEAEISQHLGNHAAMTATGVEAVRGVQTIAHTTLRPGVGKSDLRRAFREQYAEEPFVRVVAHQRGIFRYLDPKNLLGSNYRDVGYALDEDTGPLTTIGDLDNLVKGSAGNAVQCLNIRMGRPETFGLTLPDLHPLQPRAGARPDGRPERQPRRPDRRAVGLRAADAGRAPRNPRLP